MKRLLTILWLGFMICFLIACSGDSAENSDDREEMADQAVVDRANESSDAEGFSAADGEVVEMEMAEAEDSDTESVPEQRTDALPEMQMIIYTGHMRVEVDDLNDMQESIQQKITELGGYIVSSEVFETDEGESRRGHLQVRVPQKHFQAFLDHTEEQSATVLEKITNGQDVSEEYVDLESRLTSKEAVEERLLAFMEEAETTEDLLKISDDLSEVQEQIEQIKGRMEYLDNQVAYSTITINMQERQVKISELQGQDDLNTGERAQSLFMDTINFLITIGSGLVVFLIGLSPLLIPLAIVGVIIWIRLRKKKKAVSDEREE